jgi:hypothetical protein
MSKTEYHRITVLGESLRRAGIDPAIIDQIMAGGEAIRQSTPPEKKAGWLRGAMLRMDDLLDYDTRRAVRESCACCLGGKRLELMKAVARQYATLEERVRAANDAKLVCGHSVALQDDGSILVHFMPEGRASYRCPCLPQAAEPLPITYCMCCGGHIKHHLQVALGRRLVCRVRSSALSSGGTKPCTFALTLAP